VLNLLKKVFTVYAILKRLIFTIVETRNLK
jgi:hypothetical protein